jgi:hypothetical protein
MSVTWHIDDLAFRVYHVLGRPVACVWAPLWPKSLRALAAAVCLLVPMLVEVDNVFSSAAIFILGAASIVCWTLTTFTDPGILPPAINPDVTSGRQVHSAFFDAGWYREDWSAPFCRTCQHIRPRRASHCRLCKVCVIDHDHHCLVLGCCVGARNLRWFVLYLVSTTAAGFTGSVSLLLQTLEHVQVQRLSASSAIVPALTVTLAIAASVMLAFFTGRTLYVTTVGGTTRFGVSSAAAARVAGVDGTVTPPEEPRSVMQYVQRWQAIFCPEVPSVLPAYAEALQLELDSRREAKVVVVSAEDNVEAPTHWGVPTR